MIKLELNNNEAEALANVLDLAVKAGGIQVAEVALPIFYKLRTAVQENGNDRNS